MCKQQINKNEIKIKLNCSTAIPNVLQFPLFPEDESVLLNDILSMKKRYVTITAKFQF